MRSASRPLILLILLALCIEAGSANAALADAARAVMALDPTPTLITLDARGQARAAARCRQAFGRS